MYLNETKEYIVKVITEYPEITDPPCKSDDPYIVNEALYTFNQGYKICGIRREKYFILAGVTLAHLAVKSTLPEIIDILLSNRATRTVAYFYVASILVSYLGLLYKTFRTHHHNRRLEQNTKAWMDSEGISLNPAFDYLYIG